MQSVVGMRIITTLTRPRKLTFMQKRFKVKKKWAVNRKKKEANELALEHFDKFYAPIYQDLWPSIRLALLSQPKHCALVNNFSDVDASVIDLISRGADDIIKMAAEKHFEPVTQEDENTNTKKQNDESAYYDNENAEDNQENDLSRTDIHQFVSASKVFTDRQLIAMEESAQFQIPYMDVEAKVAPPINFPYHLKVHAFGRGDVSVFPQPKADKAGLLNYYPLDAASVLSVVAMNLEPGDSVLDLCAAPGGKTLTMLQTMLPGKITCIDRSYSRIGRLQQVLRSYFPGSYEGQVEVIHGDAVRLGQNITDTFDRVLVDVPCTTDRHVLQEPYNNIFRPSRARERLDLPALQKDLLCTGIQRCKVGGSIVYTTCSLAPGQNDGVVQGAMEHIWHNSKINLVVEKLDELAVRFEGTMKFYDKFRFGHLILPSLKYNFGPMYICRLKRVE